MIKKLLLVTIVLIVGLAIGFYLLNVSTITIAKNTFNIINTPQGFIQPIQTTFHNLIQNIQQNTIPTLTGIAVGATPVILVASKAYATIKNRLSAKVQEVTDQKELLQLNANTQITKLQTEKQELEEKVLTLEKPNLVIEDLTKSRDEAQALVTQQRTTIASQTATINDLHRIIEELKVKTVTQTVVK